MKIVFNAVTERLKAQVPGLRWIDLDTGQIDAYETRPPVNFPCALVDVEYPQCSDLDTTRQQVDVLVTIRVAFDQPGSTNLDAPADVRTRSLSIIDIVDAIHGSLQGFSPPEFSELSRNSMKTEKRDDGLKVFSLAYTTTLEEL